MIFVELRKEQLKVIELQIHAVCGINEHNKKGLTDLLGKYSNFVLPSSKKVKPESFEAQAKKQLSEEIKNAFVIKKKEEEVDVKSLRKNTNAAFIGAKYFKEKELSAPRFSKSTKTLPKDIIKLKR